MSQATRDARKQEVAEMQMGTGKFVLINRSNSELHLPKPSLDQVPKIQIGPGGKFIGDSYHTRHLGGLVGVVQIVENSETPDPQSTRHERLDPSTGKIELLDLGPDVIKEVTSEDTIERAERERIERAAANLGQEVVCEPGQDPRLTHPPMETGEPINLNPPKAFSDDDDVLSDDDDDVQVESTSNDEVEEDEVEVEVDETDEEEDEAEDEEEIDDDDDFVDDDEDYEDEDDDL